jgi:hypothetical protein
MTSLSQWGITIDLTPPKDEPGKQYILIGDYEHMESIQVAIQCRKTHEKEAVEIWPLENGLRRVVREAVAK